MGLYAGKGKISHFEGDIRFQSAPTRIIRVSIPISLSSHLPFSISLFLIKWFYFQYPFLLR